VVLGVFFYVFIIIIMVVECDVLCPFPAHSGKFLCLTAVAGLASFLSYDLRVQKFETL